MHADLVALGRSSLAGLRVQRHRPVDPERGDIGDVALDDVGLHLLEREGVDEDIERTGHVADPPVRETCRTGQLDRSVVGDPVVIDRDALPEQGPEVERRHGRQGWQVEVDIARAGVSAHDDLAEHAVATADLEEARRWCIDMT